jgi:tetratricopeptide (TPR) repeat protein
VIGSEVGTSRAVEVLHDRGSAIPVGGSRWTSGSGYLVGRRLVLTVAHNVDYRRDFGEDEQLLVRTIEGSVLAARVVLVGDEPSQVDLALLEISDSPSREQLTPVTVAQVNRDNPAPVTGCWAVGFPRFGEAGLVLPEGSRRETWQVAGDILPGTKRRAGLLSLQVKSTPQSLPASMAGSAWEGMSGAVVFATDAQLGELAVGVIAAHHRPEGESALTVVPITALAALPAAADWWHQLGIADPDTLPVRPPQPPADEQNRDFTSSNLRQLPTDISDFTGRDDVVQEIQRLISPKLASRSMSLVITAVSGKGGVGKTTLAVHAAHILKEDFPDGQLYVNLRGMEAQALSPSDVLGSFLRDLGVDPSLVPDSMEERARLYRSRLADRAVLILLDNAASERQILPLLPATPNSAAIITSRARLLTIPGSHLMDLDVMSLDSAIELLAKVSGWERIRQDEESAQRIVEACGNLPLAVRIVASRLASRPHWPLKKMADRLQNERRRLDELRVGDVEVRASFELGYRGRPEDERRAFRTLGILDLPEFDSWTLAALLDCDVASAEITAEQLVDSHLLEVSYEHPAFGTRYRFHDLLRVFARERLGAEESDTFIEEAIWRLGESYYALGARAQLALEPGRPCYADDRSIVYLPPGITHLADRFLNDAYAWLQLERTNMALVVQQAAQTSRAEVATALATTIPTFCIMRGSWNDWEKSYQIGLSVAERLQSPRGIGFILQSLGNIYRTTGRFQLGVAAIDRSYRVFKSINDARGEAYLLIDVGIDQFDAARWDESLESFRRSREIFEYLGDERWAAHAQRETGVYHQIRGQYDQAIADLAEALDVFRQYKDRRWAAYTLSDLGNTYRLAHSFKQAISNLHTSIGELEAIGDIRFAAIARLRLGSCYRRSGLLKEAVESLESSREVFEELSDATWTARANLALGLTRMDQSRWAEAKDQLEDSLKMYNRTDDEEGRDLALTALSQALEKLGQDSQARVIRGKIVNVAGMEDLARHLDFIAGRHGI